MLPYLIFIKHSLVTHAEESRWSEAVIRVCLSVCLFQLFVCRHDRTKTAETTITKLATGIVHHEFRLPIYY